MNRSEHTTVFVRSIWQWYANHKRYLPWRDLKIADDTERAYRILVSEVMLQQTQVSRVKIVFKNFLEKYPTVNDLAHASNSEVVLAWRGMGYNNRALRLRNTAIEIAARGSVPTELHELMSLPGVGHYTAAAIRNFAFNLPTPCLDTNIRRIIHRSFVGPENADGTWKKNDKYLLSIAQELLVTALDSSLSTTHSGLWTHRTAAHWHAALMDYGSLVCTMRSPKWEICPLTKAGVMKAAFKTPNIIRRTNKEPGRLVAGKHIPNRIFRGKIVEELRDAPEGLSVPEIGKRICIDWEEDELTVWLEALIIALKKDHLIKTQRGKVVLA